MNRFLLMFGGLWFIVGLPLAIGGVYVFAADQQFERDAQVATGTILTKDITRRRNNNGRGTSTSYSVRYRFVAPDNVLVEGTSDVPYSRWTELAERQPVEIAYLPSDPGNNRLRGTRRTFMAAMFTGLGGAFAVAGAVIALIGMRGTRRQRRLHETGLMTDAVVTDVHATRLTVNGRRQGRVHYEFRDYQGGLHSGKSTYMSLDDAMRWKQGDRIRIRYDRDQPQHSVLEEASHEVNPNRVAAG